MENHPFLLQSEDVHNLIMGYLRGFEVCRASRALRFWKDLLTPEWWKAVIVAENGASDLDLTTPPCNAATWPIAYHALIEAAYPLLVTWDRPFRRHGLEDRVAAPQMFVGRGGYRLFNYGGWSPYGPQTDLSFVPLDDIAAFTAARGILRRSPSSPRRAPPPHFQWADASGPPITRAGCQTLTPLWSPCGGVGEPSATFVSDTATALGVTAEDQQMYAMSLVLAFGGGQGSYRNEHNDWRVGVLLEKNKNDVSTGALRDCEGTDTKNNESADAKAEAAPDPSNKSPVCIHWGTPSQLAKFPSKQAQPSSSTEYVADAGDQPVARAAHSATYVPARYLEGFPEGAVVVFGGHTNDVRDELSTVDVLNIATWKWQHDVVPIDPSNTTHARHGHSASVVEVNGNGYLVVVGGGRGNILSPMRSCAESASVIVLDLRGWCWLKNTIQVDSNVGEASAVYIAGRHHTACVTAVRDGGIVIFGGGHDPSDEIFVLDAAGCVELAQKSVTPQYIPFNAAGIARTPPRPRKMHGSACLLPWLPLLVVFGGWQRGPHFDDMSFCALGDQTLGGVDGGESIGENGDEESEDAFEDDDVEDDDDEDEIVTVRLNGPQGMRVVQMPRSYLMELVASGALQGGEDDDDDDVVDDGDADDDD